jgi:NADPH-dependent glutamate synthase beta subunit-like oxidoreductase
VALGRDATAEDIAAQFTAIADMTGADTPRDALAEAMKIFARAASRG